MDQKNKIVVIGHVGISSMEMIHHVAMNQAKVEVISIDDTTKMNEIAIKYKPVEFPIVSVDQYKSGKELRRERRKQKNRKNGKNRRI